MSFPCRLSLLHPPIVFTVSANFFNSTSVSGKSSSSWRGATHYAVGCHTPRCEVPHTTLRGGIHHAARRHTSWCLALRTVVSGPAYHGAGRPEPRCRASRGTVQNVPSHGAGRPEARCRKTLSAPSSSLRSRPLHNASLRWRHLPHRPAFCEAFFRAPCTPFKKE